MCDKFKRWVSILLIIVEFVALGHLAFAQSFQVQTSIGTKTLVVPDGMTIEDAYVEMAKLYIEERADHEKLISQTEDLVEKAKKYEEVSNELNNIKSDIIDKDNEIINLYKKLNQKRFLAPLFMLGVKTEGFKKVDGVSIAAGVEIFERASLFVEMSYPWSIGLKAGVKF